MIKPLNLETFYTKKRYIYIFHQKNYKVALSESNNIIALIEVEYI